MGRYYSISERQEWTEAQVKRWGASEDCGGAAKAVGEGEAGGEERLGDHSRQPGYRRAVVAFDRHSEAIVRFLNVVAALAAASALFVQGPTISASEASRHVGEHETVCGEIAGEHIASNSRGTPTFINLDKPYPNQVFTILIWGDNRADAGHLPDSGKLCVTGTIAQYRGTPEIVLRDSRSWYVPK